MAAAGLLAVGAGIAGAAALEHKSHKHPTQSVPLEKPGGHQTGVDSNSQLKKYASEHGIRFFDVGTAVQAKSVGDHVEQVELKP